MLLGMLNHLTRSSIQSFKNKHSTKFSTYFLDATKIQVHRKVIHSTSASINLITCVRCKFYAFGLIECIIKLIVAAC